MIRVLISPGAREFLSLLQTVQIFPEARPFSYSMNIGSFFLEGKVAEA
jgi:hypothetical protein